MLIANDHNVDMTLKKEVNCKKKIVTNKKLSIKKNKKNDTFP